MTEPPLVPRRRLVRQIPIDVTTLPPDPDPDRLPRFATRQQLAVIHQRYFGPLSPRTLERLALPYRRPPGQPALYEVREFLAWAEKRLAEAPRLMGGSRRRPETEDDSE
jgi:hypothetical protein